YPGVPVPVWTTLGPTVQPVGTPPAGRSPTGSTSPAPARARSPRPTSRVSPVPSSATIVRRVTQTSPALLACSASTKSTSRTNLAPTWPLPSGSRHTSSGITTAVSSGPPRSTHATALTLIALPPARG